MKVYALVDFDHDGKPYKAGDEVDLPTGTDEQRAGIDRLISSKVVSETPPDDKPDDKEE